MTAYVTVELNPAFFPGAPDVWPPHPFAYTPADLPGAAGMQHHALLPALHAAHHAAAAQVPVRSYLWLPLTPTDNTMDHNNNNKTTVVATSQTPGNHQNDDNCHMTTTSLVSQPLPLPLPLPSCTGQQEGIPTYQNPPVHPTPPPLSVASAMAKLQPTQECQEQHPPLQKTLQGCVPQSLLITESFNKIHVSCTTRHSRYSLFQIAMHISRTSSLQLNDSSLAEEWVHQAI